MFWILRKSLSWALSLAALVLLLVLVLPGDYQREVSILIRAPRSRVYAKARQLNEWNILATFAGLSRKRLEIPPEIAGYASEAGGFANWTDRGLDEAAASLPRFRITEARYPALVAYRMDGGPLPGVEPRIVIEEAPSADWKATTRVTIREQYQFSGFWAGVKALSGRFAAEKLHRRNLERLRDLCEAPEPARDTETGVRVESESSAKSENRGGERVRANLDRAAARISGVKNDVRRVREDVQRVLRKN